MTVEHARSVTIKKSLTLEDSVRPESPGYLWRSCLYTVTR